MTKKCINYFVEYKQKNKQKNKWIRCISCQETPELAKEHAKNLGVKKYRIVKIIEETTIEEIVHIEN